MLLSLVPTALDEPLVQGLPTTSELRQSGHAFVLIKPMVLGSIETIALLEERAQAAKVQVCVSHFFDGPQALKFYWALHDALPQAVSPAGLSNHPGLQAYA